MSDFVKGGNEKISENDEKIFHLPKYKKFITLIDEETGKTVGHFPLQSKNLGKGWVAVYQIMAVLLARLKLTNEQYRVFLALIGKIDFDNYLTINQTALAEEIDMKQPHIARAIKNLCERNIIIEGPRAGLNKTYRFNPYIAHKGSEREKTIVEFEKLLEEKRKE